MNRRRFLQWLGIGAAVAAVPAVAKSRAAEEELTYFSQPIVIDQMNPMLHVMRTKWVSLEEAKEIFPRMQEMEPAMLDGAGPCLVQSMLPAAARVYSRLLKEPIKRGNEFERRFLTPLAGGVSR